MKHQRKRWNTLICLALGCLLMMGLASVALAEAPAETAPTEAPAPEAEPSWNQEQEAQVTTEVMPSPTTENCACFSCDCVHACEALMGQSVQSNATPFDPSVQPTSNCGCVHSCESMMGLSMNHHHTHHHSGLPQQEKHVTFNYRIEPQQQPEQQSDQKNRTFNYRIAPQQPEQQQSNACPNCGNSCNNNRQAKRFGGQRSRGPQMRGHMQNGQSMMPGMPGIEGGTQQAPTNP